MTAAALGSVTSATTEPDTPIGCGARLVVAGFCVLGWIGGLLPRRAAVAARARRLHDRHRVHHGGLPARQAARHRREGRTASSREMAYVAAPSRRCARPDAGARAGHARPRCCSAALMAPRAPMALIGMLGAAAAGALLDLQRTRHHRHRHDPCWPAGPGDCRTCRLDGVLSLLASGAGGGLRRLHRQHPDRSGVRRTDGTSASTPSESCWRSVPRTWRPGLMHGFPVSSSGSRTAIGRRRRRANPTHQRCHRAGTTVLGRLQPRPLLASFPPQPSERSSCMPALRLVDIAEFRSAGGFRRTESCCRPRHHGRRCCSSGCSQGYSSPSGCRCSTC